MYRIEGTGQSRSRRRLLSWCPVTVWEAGLPNPRAPSLSTSHEGDPVPGHASRWPVRPSDAVLSPGRVGHGHHAVRGPLGAASARRHAPRGRGRHQSVPERGLPSALRGLGEHALRSRPQSVWAARWLVGLYIPGRRPQRLQPGSNSHSARCVLGLASRVPCPGGKGPCGHSEKLNGPEQGR